VTMVSQSSRRSRASVAQVLASLSLLLFALRAEAAPPTGYYDTVNTSNAALLRSTLHQVIDDHTRFPYTASGTDTWDILEAAQQDPSNASNIIDVYKNASYPKVGGGTGLYNREHVWPKSYGFPDDVASNYPYTDCHLLHLSDSSYNGARGVAPYGTCSASCSVLPTVATGGVGGGTGPYPDDDNWYIGAGGSGGLLGRWEVWTGRRGDLARALLYADVRYEGGTHGVTGAAEPDLILTDDESLIVASSTSSNASIAYMGMLSVLLQWHQQDPVDDFERNRNEVVYGHQGNRNPFVDHPEWVALLFGSGVPACVGPSDCDDGSFCNGVENCAAGQCTAGTNPCSLPLICSEAQDACVPGASTSTVWINEFHYDNSGTDTGEFVEVAGTAGSDLSGWRLIGYSGADGALYATIPLSGVIPNQQGCTGTLSFGFVGLQNGAPDGIALVDANNQLVEFISYEGLFTVSTGPAAGYTSVDVGRAETGSTPIGQSLQLSGTGASRVDFTWMAPPTQTPGSPNQSQTFDACAPPQPVPALGGYGWLLGLALPAMACAGMSRKQRLRA